MSKLKRLAPKTCPDCNAEGTLFIDDDRNLTCQLCGYKDVRGKQTSNKLQETDEERREKLQITYGMPNSSDVDRWAKTKYASGLDYAQQGKWDDAIRSFEQAIDHQHDFVDAHLWLARISLDPDKKRNHYGEVIAYMPKNLEAMRELMVLNGDMTREEADRAADMSQERDVREAEHAVGTQLTEIACSNCKGTLEVPHGSSEIRCKFCGHLEQIATSSGLGLQSLAAAMLKERGQGITWRVGKYLLHCDNCGAERILTSRKMTVDCPFCGSDHVIKTDALKSFRQPDGIIPFKINPNQARESLDNALNSFGERLKGFFVNNRAESIRMTPVYLPFWIFDVTAQITITRTDYESKRELGQFYDRQSRQQLDDGLNNVPYCGVESPPHHLTDRLEAFDYTEAKPYDPRLLANFTAEIYSIDYQQASLNVRGEIGERFRFRHGHNPNVEGGTRVSHLIQQMSFRLMLLPVWVATIIEEDADVRLGLVHGQTGQALLGKAWKPVR